MKTEESKHKRMLLIIKALMPLSFASGVLCQMAPSETYLQFWFGFVSIVALLGTILAAIVLAAEWYKNE